MLHYYYLSSIFLHNMELFLFVAVIVVGLHFGRRISMLEDRIEHLESGQVAEVAPRPIPVPQSVFAPADVATAFAEIDRQQNTATPRTSSFFDWVAQDFMMKLGSLLLLIAVGWFVSYAIMEQWIGPVGQITLGILFGVGILVLGVWRIAKHRHQGGIFTVLGAAIILLTLLAARGVYDFFTPASVLMIMFLTVSFVAFVSVRYRSERLAFAGLLLANMAPFFTAAMPMPAIELFSYLLIITVGILSTVWVTGWTKLTLLSLLCSYFYSVAYLVDAPVAEQDVTLLFSFVLVSIYFAANMVSLVRRHGEGTRHLTTHALTALGTAIFLFTWIESSISQEWKSLLYTAWALVFALGTYVVYFFTANQKAFYLYGATSAALIGVATAAELAGPVLVVVYLLEIGFLILAAGKLGMATPILARMSWLFTVPLLLSLESFTVRGWRSGIPAEHCTVLVAVVVIISLIGWYLYERGKQEGENPLVITTAGTLLTIGGMYAVSLVWLVLHGLMSFDVATMLSLIIYTVVGILLFMKGANSQQLLYKIIGGTLIAFVVIRLLLVEVWNMELEGRIATFLVIGILLISTAFIRKKKEQIVSDVE